MTSHFQWLILYGFPLGIEPEAKLILSLFYFKYLNFALVVSFTTPFYLGCLMTFLFLNNQLMVSIYCNCLTFNYTRFAYQRHSSCYDVAHIFTFSLYRCFYSYLTIRKECTFSWSLPTTLRCTRGNFHYTTPKNALKQ